MSRYKGNRMKTDQEILDTKEKKYLSAVIKPIRKEVDYIAICDSLWFDEKKHAHIWCHLSIGLKHSASLDFPAFKIGKMYKGMEKDRHYSLEELGLFENKQEDKKKYLIINVTDISCGFSVNDSGKRILNYDEAIIDYDVVDKYNPDDPINKKYKKWLKKKYKNYDLIVLCDNGEIDIVLDKTKNTHE